MTDFDENVNSPTETEKRTAVSKKRKTIVIAIIAVFCICLVVLVGVSIKRRNSGETAPTEEIQTSKKVNKKLPEKGFGPEPGECEVLGVVIVEGKTYVQTTTDKKSYTPDVYLGEASDFEGTYKTQLTDVKGKVYTVKESKDILIVKIKNGSVVTLVKSEE